MRDTRIGNFILAVSEVGIFVVIAIFLEDLQDRWADRHSRIKVAKIRRVFAREGGLISGIFSSVGRQVCGHPGRCAMGALLVAAGVLDSNAIAFGVNAEHGALVRKIYGLNYTEVSNIISTNDGSMTKDIWRQCGIKLRPEERVRVCVVNDKVRELASA